MKKKYLLITPWCPYPPYKNGGIHTIYNILNNLPIDVKMDLFYYADHDSEAENEVLKCVSNIYYQELLTKTTKKSRINNLLIGIPDLLSGVNMRKFSFNLNFDFYDVIVLDQVFSLEFMKIIPSNKTVIGMMHDNHILMFSRKFHQEKLMIKKLYDKLQCLYYKKYEEKYYKLLDKVLYVSNFDAAYSKKIHPYYKEKFDDITLGVEMPKSEQLSVPVEEFSLVFSGVMNYGPNEDAAVYFANEIFPKIRKIIPSCTLTLAGMNPTERVLELQRENVIVTGFVDDMIHTITKSSVYVSPLRYGSGTKNKVLEAMAAGMPVMLSSVSREGINGLIDQENCIFIDDDEWVDKTVDLLQDTEKRNRIAKQGKVYVQEKHSWEKVFDKFLV